MTAYLIAACAFLSLACATLPRRTSDEPTASLKAPTTGNNLRININSASDQELEKLPGIGKAIAERILLHRSQYGPFRRPEHLMMVRGISDAKFRKIRSMITVE